MSMEASVKVGNTGAGFKFWASMVEFFYRMSMGIGLIGCFFLSEYFG